MVLFPIDPCKLTATVSAKGNRGPLTTPRDMWAYLGKLTTWCVAVSVLYGCATIDSLERQGGGRTYDSSYVFVYQVALDALEEVGLVVKRENYEQGVIRARGGSYMTGAFLCSGNLVGVFLKQLGPSKTLVEVQERYVLATQVLGCHDKAPLFVSRMVRKLKGSVSVSASPTQRSSYPNIDVGAGKQVGEYMQDLVNQLFSAGFDEHGISRIAVLPVGDASRSVNRPLGTYLTERLTNTLYKTGAVKVVERSQLSKVTGELALSMTGRFDEASVKRIGKMLGVDAVIVGTYAELGAQSIEVNSRIVGVETGEVLGAGTIQIPKAIVQELLR